MATFLMLTRLGHEGLKSPGSLADLSHEVMNVPEELPGGCLEVELCRPWPGQLSRHLYGA